MNRIRLAGQFLRAYRERAGLSFNQAADKLGCSLTLLSFLENGTRSLARKVSYQAVQALYGLDGEELRLLRLLYGDKDLLLGAEPSADWRLFSTVVEAWEARPGSFTSADADELLGAGLGLFQAHPAELHAFYTRLDLALGETGQARAHAERALEAWRPDSFVALEGLYNNLGEVCFRQGQGLEARLQAQILAAQLSALALGGEPGCGDEALRAETLAAYGDARAHFLQALARQPDYERGAFQLGLIHYNLAVIGPPGERPERYAQALDWLGRVLRGRDPTGSEAHERRLRAVAFAVLARIGLGDTGTARLLLDALLSLRPDAGFAHYIEAIALLKAEHDAPAALAALDRAGALEPRWLTEAGAEIEFYPLRVYLQRQGGSLEAWLAADRSQQSTR